jgi:hypothetical protein|tara:strand:+ start:619 stop:843 length:225 start_codon:yes stop_codon:yes gene_type:complete
LIVLIAPFDDTVKIYASSEIPEDLKGLIISQLRVVIVHSVGAGIIMLFCREFRRYIRYKKGVKRIFLFWYSCSA